ncbi:hypothetical protein ANCDUO_03621 [Ancylostoma duodenale]|uniref:Uncharacterized protein n=1 Tax=Ancylostoma duodenale TaxID=51022 RepID=A0A0C2DTC4_9BILA|nr:hypothetical protein ANCDUO_03621 [Ancylostoma duodenale]
MESEDAVVNAMQREPAKRREREEVRRGDENDIIQENAIFMEGVNDDINEPDSEDAQNEDNGRGMEDHQAEEPEYQRRVKHIEAELHSLDDAMADLQDIILEVENEQLVQQEISSTSRSTCLMRGS